MLKISKSIFLFSFISKALTCSFQRREPLLFMLPLWASSSVFRSNHYHRKSLLSNCAPSPVASILFRPLLSTFSFDNFCQILLKPVSIYTASSLQQLLLPTIIVSVVLSLLSIFFSESFSYCHVYSNTSFPTFVAGNLDLPLGLPIYTSHPF